MPIKMSKAAAARKRKDKEETIEDRFHRWLKKNRGILEEMLAIIGDTPENREFQEDFLRVLFVKGCLRA